MPTGDKKKKTVHSNTRTLNYSTASNKSLIAKKKLSKSMPKSFASLSTSQKNKVARKNKRAATKQMGSIAKSVGSRHRENPASVMAAERTEILKKAQSKSARTGKPVNISSKKMAKLGLATKNGGTGMDIKTAKKAGLSVGKTRSGNIKSTKKR